MATETTRVFMQIDDTTRCWCGVRFVQFEPACRNCLTNAPQHSVAGDIGQHGPRRLRETTRQPLQFLDAGVIEEAEHLMRLLPLSMQRIMRGAG